MRSRLLAVLTAVPLAAAALSGCSAPQPTHGYVYSINYNPPGSTWWPGYWYTSCSGSGRYRTCYSEYSPGWTQYIPASWQIELCKKPGVPSQSNSCGWRDVDQHTYQTVRLGQFWTSVAGVTPSTT